MEKRANQNINVPLGHISCVASAQVAEYILKISRAPQEGVVVGFNGKEPLWTMTNPGPGDDVLNNS